MANALIVEPAALGDVVVSSCASGCSGRFLDRDEAGLVWRTTPGANTQWVIVAFDTDQPIDTVLLLGLAGAQSGWTMTIDLATRAQGRFTGEFWSSGAVPLLAGSEMPVSGLGKALWRAPAGAPGVAGFLRITIGNLEGAMFEASRLVVSKAIQLERNFKYGAALGVRPLGTVNWSTRGVLLRRKGKKLPGVGLSFGSIHRDEVEEMVMPLLLRVGNDEAIAIVLDPDPDPQLQNRIWFGFLTGDLGTTWARPGGFQADFNLVEVG